MPSCLHCRTIRVAALCLLLLLNACVADMSGPERHLETSAPARVYDDSTPVQVFDAYTLSTFMGRHAEACAKAGLTPEQLKSAEQQTFAAGDWRPDDYGQALRQRLDLRSFPSLLTGFTNDSQRTHLAPSWQTVQLDKTAYTGRTDDLECTYVVFATADWNGNGVRDWLVLHTQQSPHDRTLRLAFWLVITDPQPKGGLLQAQLLAIDEYEGLAARSIPAGEARDYVAGILNDRILPAAGRPASAPR